MLSLIAWSLLAFLAFAASTGVYAIVQAIVGRAFGIEVVRVGIGADYFGLAVARWQGRHWEWVIGIAPWASYTKFRSDEDREYTEQIREDGILKGVRVVEFSEEDDAKRASTPPSPGTYQAASLGARLLILFSGPFAQTLLGIAFLVAALVMGGRQLRLSEAGKSDVLPCSVGGLILADQPVDWGGQVLLFREIAGGLSRKILWTEQRGDWGALLGFIITTGAAAKVSLSAALSCLGVLISGMGVLNLLPLGVLNGGQMINACLIALVGEKRSDRVIFGYAMLSLAIVLMILLRAIVSDVAWLLSLRG